MSQPDIPKAPETLRATPRAIAHELEPFIERITISVLAEVNQLIAGLITRVDHQGVTFDKSLHQVGNRVVAHYQEIMTHLRHLEERLESLTATVDAHGAQLAEHQHQLRTLSARVAGRKAPRRKEKRRAAKPK